MKQWIRWPGLIGFVVFSVLLVAGWLFAAGPLMKMALEAAGTKAVGAKVDVQSVDLTLSPMGIVIQGVQVTDAENPMTNIVSIDRAEADVAFVPLLLGKGIVEEMSLTGVAFGSARTESGAIEQEEATSESSESSDVQNAAFSKSSKIAAATEQKEESALAGMSQAIPSAEEVLDREPLKTVEHGKAFKQSYDTHKKNIDDTVANVPNASALKDYEKRLNKILNGKFKSVEDFQQRKKALDQLQKQFKQDKQAIAAAKKAIAEGKKEINANWKALSSAPESDYENLISKYSLNGQGAANLSALLFGQEGAERAEQALYYYEKISPLLASDSEDESSDASENTEEASEAVKGRYVHFKTDRPLPDVWIKKLAFSTQLEGGDLAVTVNNISTQQNVTGLPTTMIMRSAKLGDMEGMVLNAVLDRTTGTAKDTFDLAVSQLNLKKMDLGMAGLKLDRSKVKVDANAQIIQGQLTALGKAGFTQAKFSTKDKTIVAKELNNALAQIPSFDVNVDAKGKLKSPDVGFNSDLDNKLQKIFNQVLKNKQKAFEKELKEKLKQKMMAYAGDHQGLLKDLGVQDGNISNLDKKLNDLSRKKLASFEDQKKKEAAAKAKKKRKELEKQAKDKLKNLF